MKKYLVIILSLAILSLSSCAEVVCHAYGDGSGYKKKDRR